MPGKRSSQRRGQGMRRYPHRVGRKERQIILLRKSIICGVAILLFVMAFLIIQNGIKKNTKEVISEKAQQEELEDLVGKPDIQVKLLSVNPYSRPGKALKKVKHIVIHYTGNPGTSAMNNRNYFEGLKESHITKASSHFIVGLEGEIVQCVPTKEISYASNERNKDSISIENCHPDETGKFNEATYNSLIKLTAWLCKKFDLTEDAVIRHYDVTKKECPIYFVKNEDQWVTFKKGVQSALETLKEKE